MRKNKEEFVEMIERYLKGDCTREEQLLVEQWYSSLGRKKSTLADVTQQGNADHLQIIEDRLRNNIHKHVVSRRQPEKRPAIVMWRYAAAAACLLIVLFSVSDIVSPKMTDHQTDLTKQHVPESFVFKSIGESKSIELPDGSRVVLEPHSELQFKESPGERVIHLTGEAFFDVTPDKTRPFYVHASGLVTKVLGTTFTVKAPAGSLNASVSVQEGKVSVYPSVPENGDSSEVILLPNQQAIYNAATRHVEARLVDSPIQVKILTEEEIHYKEKPVGEILRGIEKTYGIKIQFDEKAFNRCVLTTTFSDEGFYDRLDIICSAIGSTYKKVDTQISLTNPNCSKP